MDKKPAIQFKNHMTKVVEELSLGLLVAHGASSSDEFSEVRKLVAELIAGVDDVLYQVIYNDHPDLNDLGKEKSK